MDWIIKTFHRYVFKGYNLIGLESADKCHYNSFTVECLKNFVVNIQRIKQNPLKFSPLEINPLYRKSLTLFYVVVVVIVVVTTGICWSSYCRGRRESVVIFVHSGGCIFWCCWVLTYVLFLCVWWSSHCPAEKCVIQGHHETGIKVWWEFAYCNDYCCRRRKLGGLIWNRILQVPSQQDSQKMPVKYKE